MNYLTRWTTKDIDKIFDAAEIFILFCRLRTAIFLRNIKGPRMEFSDTFQSRPLVLTPTNNPCLFTEKILRVTDHHFFEKLFTAGKMAFYNLGRDLGV